MQFVSSAAQASVRDVPWDDMQALFASTYVDEIAAAQREGGEAVLRDKVAALTPRSVLPTAPRTLPSTHVQRAGLGFGTSIRERWERWHRPDRLTAREGEILSLTAAGLTNAQIGGTLFLSPSTVRTHLEHIFEKLGVHSRTAAVAWLHTRR